MEHIVSLDKAVTGFNFAIQSIDCLCGTEIVKIEKQSGKLVCTK